MVFCQILSKIFHQPIDKRALSATCYYADCQPVVMNLFHQLRDARHDACLGECMELACLLVVHPLSLGLVDVASLLAFHHHADRVNAACSLCGVCIIDSHLDAKYLHRPLPGNSMMGHRVIEYAVHIEKHGLGAKCLKAVFF